MRYRTKFNNQKIVTPDGKFDSKKEYKRWLELKEMEAQGKITNLMRQVPFELVPHQKHNGKVIELAVKYYADFTYEVDGVRIVEDTKGVKTDVYKIKRKLMLERYGIRIKEV